LKGTVSEIFIFFLHLNSNVLPSVEGITWNPDEGKKRGIFLPNKVDSSEQLGNIVML